MIFPGRFTPIFGVISAGDLVDDATSLESRRTMKRVAISAVDRGLAMTLAHPGTDVPICTLTPQERRAAGADHRCGAAHAIADPTRARKVFDRFAKRGPFNIAVVPGAGCRDRLVVVEFTALEQLDAFHAESPAEVRGRIGDDPHEWLTVAGPGVLGQAWFWMPEGVGLAGDVGSYTDPAGWSVTWRGRAFLAPPSRIAAGGWRWRTEHDAPPDWLLARIGACGEERLGHGVDDADAARPVAPGAGRTATAVVPEVVAVADELEVVLADQSGFSATSREALAARALAVDYARAAGVRPVLGAADLPDEFCGYPTPGMLFPHADPLDPSSTVLQYRPDVPTGSAKYVFPKGQHQPLSLIRPADAGGRTRAVVIVEGTCQSLAFARYAPPQVAVYAIAGCSAWSRDGKPTDRLQVVNGQDVFVILDGDSSTNPDVYKAGKALASALASYGAVTVAFPRLPVRGTNGLDDYLASVPEELRAEHVARLIAEPPDVRTRTRLEKPADAVPKAKRRKALALDPDELPPNDDDSLATAWAAEHRDRFRWLRDSGRGHWLRYEHGRWSPCSNTDVDASVRVALREVAGHYLAAANACGDDDMVKYLREAADALRSRPKVDRVRAMAAGDPTLTVVPEELDAHPRLWAASNCVIDLLSGEVRDHSPDLLLTSGSDVPYDPAATCPRFDEFYADVLRDPEVRAFVMRLFGVALFGEVRGNAHVFPIFLGRGRNGKGTLIKVMAKLFGAAHVTVDSRCLLQQKFPQHSQEVAKLRGRRLATTQETSEHVALDVARVKSWTGGDRLTGRRMQENDEEFDATHLLIMASNHRPEVPASEVAYWSRVREVPFPVSVEGREDVTLEPAILGGELSGVLNRVLAGARDYLARGLDAPAAVLVATATARAEADHVAEFVRAHVEVSDPNADGAPRAANVDLYRALGDWWSRNAHGQRKPTDREFKAQLRDALCNLDGAAGVVGSVVASDDNPRRRCRGTEGDLRTLDRWFGLRLTDVVETHPHVVAMSSTSAGSDDTTPGDEAAGQNATKEP
jgi:putative DNA primase/helicase